jgi:SAM-dependent methyltransferase
MNPEEYEALERVELTHWFYAGKRQIVLTWLRRLGALGSDRLLVDCGAGTGRFVLEARRECRAIAVDDHDESLVIARKYLGEDGVRRGSCMALEFDDASADVVTALDVIEHVPDDVAAVREMTRILRPGGVMVITVPALMALWSDWDVSLHHFRRYRREPLRDLLRGAGLEVPHCAYINVFPLPAVWLLRKLRTWFPKPAAPAGSRAEEKVPPAWLNGFLLWLFVASATQTWVSFPAGVGLLAVARRPAR